MAHVNKSEKNWDCAVSGKRGDGKSFTAVMLALILDDTFDISRVVYSIEEFLHLVKILPPGSAIVADEIAEWFSSRNFMKSDNKDLSAILQIFRVNRLIVIYTLPSMYQVDKNLRTMSDVYIAASRVHRDKNLCECRYYDIEIHPIRGKEPYTIHPVITGPDGYKKKITRVYFDRIPKELEKQYIAKKKAFNIRVIDEKLQKKEDSLNKEEKVKRKFYCKKCDENFMSASVSDKPCHSKCRATRTELI